MERAKGFEPSTSTLARSHSTAELYPHMASGVGIEPMTRGFAVLIYQKSKACIKHLTFYILDFLSIVFLLLHQPRLYAMSFPVSSIFCN